MPYIQIAATRRLTEGERLDLRACALDAAALLGKKREHLMVRIEDGLALSKGDGENVCVFCDVRILGAATPEACDAFAARLSADAARIAHTDPGCVYLSLSELTRCYTDGCLPPGHAAPPPSDG